MNQAENIKAIWTDHDFDQMGWHDSKIHAVAFEINEYEIAFDLDYILEWTSPPNSESPFKFLVAPATLIFRNVHDLYFDLPSASVIIDAIERHNPRPPLNAAYIKDSMEHDWVVATGSGEIKFKSTGFVQYLRQKPLLTDGQSLSLAQRNNISFDITTF